MKSIATLTMNRPEARNALSMEMRSALADVLHDIEQDSSVRCVVLQGAGQHFMAGGDVKFPKFTLDQILPGCAEGGIDSGNKFIAYDSWK